ncbi:hypothetical protein KY348_06805 [Candidatus Woesearchaeota archaeon]|nr:hypothetical protein [Candidatus Woesearchaeota archaeon]
MAKQINIDFKQMLSKLDIIIDRLSQKIKAYFKSLTQYETYAWIAMGVGFVMVLIALITW